MKTGFFSTYKRLVPIIKKYIPMYIIGVLFLLLTNSGQLLIPQALRFALDHLDFRFQAIIAIGILASLVAVGRIGWRFFIVGAARRTERDLRRAVFHHLTLLEPQYYFKTPVGELMSRLTNDLQNVRMSLGMSVITFVDGSFMGISIITILLLTNFFLGALSILPFFFLIIIFLIFGKKVGELFAQSMKAFAQISDEAQEALTGIRVIQSFNREQFFLERMKIVGEKYLKIAIRLVQLWGLYFPIVSFVVGLTVWILVAVGSNLLLKGEITTGSFAAFLGYLGMLAWPMISVAFTIDMLQRGASSLRRLFEIIDTTPLITSSQEAKRPENFFPIKINNLTFKYQPNLPPAIENLSFTIEEKQVVGVLGTIGSGKSTLAWLLCRLLEPPPNTIFMGGQDIRTWPLDDLRACFSMVPQTPFLFSDTIRNNILMGNPHTTDEELTRVIEIAGLAKDLDIFPKGLQTLVGERGITLSGGQKQRVALARALLASRPILILDDALSAVDAKTEAHIIKYLFSHQLTRTIIIISHRISTLMNCNQVLVLDGGRLIQSGSPKELLAQEGMFSNIAAIQHYYQRKTIDG